jgi:ubiquinone/menaquinone biosynthesis C-methylase UbiE
MNKKEFNNFFKPYSKNVDNANKHGFWKLSDAIITQIIIDNIPINSKETSIIFDAGGGTGRWACNLSRIYKTKFIVYDMSKDMLKKAKTNIKTAKIENRVKLIEGDLKDIKHLKTKSVDYIISVYSPISFINKKEKAFKELFRILKTGGIIIIMGHGFYNAIASKINNYYTDIKELKDLNNKHLVKWGINIPSLNVFSKEIIENDLKNAGFYLKKTYGVPVFVQPGPEDFDSENIKKSKISLSLENKDFFNKVFELEMKYNSNPTVANRGMNIFAVAVK